MDKAFIDDLEQWLACLVHDPNDAVALAQMQAQFDALLAAPDAGEVGHLPSAIQNLLQCLTDGAVAPDMAAIELLVEACAVLAQADSADALQLVERLDAFASGLGAVPADASPVQEAPRPLPPLLTVREDGSRISPGTFDSDESQHTTTLRPPLDTDAALPRMRQGPASAADIVAALAPAVDRLGAQVGALELLAGAELKRLADDLSVSAAEIAQLRDALVEWAERDAAKGHWDGVE